MVSSGVGVIEAMNVISGYRRHSHLKEIIIKIKQDVTKGSPLGDSLAQYPHFFPSWQINIVKYSQDAGSLPGGLQQIVKYLQRDVEIKKRLMAGLAYPVILLHLAIFLLPISELVNTGLGGYSWEVIKVLTFLYGTILIFYWLDKFFTANYKSSIDRFALQIPVFGGLIKQLELSKFIRALQCMYNAGVNITQSWRIASRDCSNVVLRNFLLQAVGVIKKGDSLIKAFTVSGVFSPRMISMIAAGENSGNIGKSLEVLAVNFEKQTDTVIGTLLVVVPVIVYMGVVLYIGYKIISFYLNYFSNILGALG